MACSAAFHESGSCVGCALGQVKGLRQPDGEALSLVGHIGAAIAILRRGHFIGLLEGHSFSPVPLKILPCPGAKYDTVAFRVL